MHAGAGHAYIEQTPLLLDLLGRLGVDDGQRAFGEPHEEHRIPFKALGGVQGRERDALQGRRVLRGGALLQFADEVGEAGPGLSAAMSSASWARAARDSQRARAAPAPSGGRSENPAPDRTCRTVWISPMPSVSASPPARAAPRRRTTASRTSGRSKNRSAPRSTYGTPTAASADSYVSDCALIRYRIAISRAGTPSSISLRARRAASSARRPRRRTR